MGTLFYGVIPADPLTFETVALLLWMVALVGWILWRRSGTSDGSQAKAPAPRCL